jgi:hypothetical protein
MMKTIAQFGFSVWMLILICVVSLLYAGVFFVRGGARRLRTLAALTVALCFITLAAMSMGLAIAGRSGAMGLDRGDADALPGMVMGMAESFAGGVMGFGTMTLVALIVGAALWRGTSLE